MLEELGLVHGAQSCVYRKKAVSRLSREALNELVKQQPYSPRLVDGIVIRYLVLRVQHVSNRIFETRCLPI